MVGLFNWRLIFDAYFNFFTRRDAMLARILAMALCLSVCEKKRRI